jgi:hypothetical protein
VMLAWEDRVAGRGSETDTDTVAASAS